MLANTCFQEPVKSFNFAITLGPADTCCDGLKTVGDHLFFLLVSGFATWLCTSGLLQFVHTSVLHVSFCSTFRAIGNFGTVPLKVTRQIAVEAKALIWLSGLLLTAFHSCTICRFWHILLIFSCNGRL